MKGFVSKRIESKEDCFVFLFVLTGKYTVCTPACVLSSPEILQAGGMKGLKTHTV